MKKLFVSICVIICLLLCGCSKTNSPSAVVKDYIKNGKDILKLGALGSLNFDDSSDSIPEDFAKELLDIIFDFEYKVVNESVDGDEALVDVSFTNYDLELWVTNGMAAFLQKAIGLAFTDASDDVMETILVDILKEEFKTIKDKGKTKNINVTFNLNKIDGEWILDEEEYEDAFINAVTGGMTNAFDNINDTFSNFIE